VPDVGIDEVGADLLAVEQDGLSLTVANPQGLELKLVDMQGRTLATSRSTLATLALPSAGVYMLQAGDTCRKIVAF
jgi:hypothetical protein